MPDRADRRGETEISVGETGGGFDFPSKRPLESRDLVTATKNVINEPTISETPVTPPNNHTKAKREMKG